MDTIIVDETGLTSNGTYNNSRGGTEMMAEKIQSVLEEMQLDDQINLIHSRVRDIDPDKKNVYVVHDTWRDPECGHLSIEEDRKRFDKIVFVSNQQLQSFHLGLGVPYSEGLVMKNSIEPIQLSPNDKPTDRINLIYHTTPHRGLELLVPAFEYLAEKYDNIYLDVYSSFKIYGWDHRDKEYQGLFARIKNHPRMTYHGYQSNTVVREALKRSHIFAYPCIWPETSCIAALEAMSAGCEIVCPNYEALPETTAGFALEYQFTEDVQEHLNIFACALEHSIRTIDSEYTKAKLKTAKTIIDTQYGWEVRREHWQQFFNSLV